MMQYLCSTPSLSGFFPEPCPISESSGTRQGSGINNAVDCLTLQSLPFFPDVWCPAASSSDHRPFLSSESCRWFSEACRLLQSMTTSFSVDYRLVSYSTYGVLWIPPHEPPLTLPPGITSIWVVFVLCDWFWFLLYAFPSYMRQVLIRLIFVFP